jgi:hypothetical protein
MNINFNNNINFDNNIKYNFKINMINNSFYYLINHIIFLNENVTMFMLKGLYSYIIYKKSYSIKIKYNFLREIMENKFLTAQQLDLFMDSFNKIQRCNFGFQKLAYKFKFNKAEFAQKNDLCMNDIDTSKKNNITILHNDKKYIFIISDLINLVNMALLNSANFFSEPLVIKNPYTNLAFNKSTLYNIYFLIRFHSLIIPDLLHKFFLTNFDLREFKTRYEYLLREGIIDKYINNSDVKTLHNSILSMILEYNCEEIRKKILIDKDFPLNKLTAIMKPYLKLYLNSKYSLIETNRVNYEILLHKKLLAFYKFNPLFGRKMINVERKNILGLLKKTLIFKNSNLTYYFHEKHIPFNTNDSMFLNNHISSSNIRYENILQIINHLRINNNENEPELVESESSGSDSDDETINNENENDNNNGNEDDYEEEEQNIYQEENMEIERYYNQVEEEESDSEDESS